MSEKDKPNSFEASNSLKGQLLLAMPQMGDPRFHKAVIFLCVQDDKGAMGLVVNQIMAGVGLHPLLQQLDITMDFALTERLEAMPIVCGGPVEPARGFLLHTPDFRQKDTILIDEQFSISGTIDSLKALITGPQPNHMLFALGYAGWGAGQLEQELQDNAWITVPATHDLLFNTDKSDMWDRAFATLGVNPLMISGVSGHA